jgi:hypothetical protein
MLWLFGLLSLFGLAFAVALRRHETSADGHGLERPKPPSELKPMR